MRNKDLLIIFMTIGIFAFLIGIGIFLKTSCFSCNQIVGRPPVYCPCYPSLPAMFSFLFGVIFIGIGLTLGFSEPLAVS